MGRDFKPYEPKTITRALRNLRGQIIRNGGPGLEHVEALLLLRGDKLGPVPRKLGPIHFQRGKLRVAIFAVLRAGPLTGPHIVEGVCAAHGLGYSAMYRSVYSQLGDMKCKGLLRHEGPLWGLAL
jgi:hypothetical protein